MIDDSNDTEMDWVDPDDAPELDEQWLERAYHYHGRRLLKRGYGRDPLEKLKVERKKGQDI